LNDAHLDPDAVRAGRNRVRVMGIFSAIRFGRFVFESRDFVFRRSFVRTHRAMAKAIFSWIEPFPKRTALSRFVSL